MDSKFHLHHAQGASEHMLVASLLLTLSCGSSHCLASLFSENHDKGTIINSGVT